MMLATVSEARLDLFRDTVSDPSIKHALAVGSLSSNPFRCERSSNLAMALSIPTDHVARHACIPHTLHQVPFA